MLVICQCSFPPECIASNEGVSSRLPRAIFAVALSLPTGSEFVVALSSGVASVMNHNIGNI